MEEKVMDKSELTTVLSVLNDKVEIWVESDGGGVIPVTDYDFDLENNRIILRLSL